MVKKYLALSCFPLFFIVYAFIITPYDQIFEGIKMIIRSPDLLITDYMVVGGIGAAFVNAGLVTLFGIWIMFILKMKITGPAITALSLLFGFALFGKNIVNIWAIFLGTFLYSVYHKEHLSKYILTAYYGASLSPLVTMMYQWKNWSPAVNIIVGLIFGIAIGFILPPLASHLKSTHRGYSLYNAGFACGMIATVFCSICKAFGMEWNTVNIWLTGENKRFMILLAVFFGIIILIGLIKDKSFKPYWNLLKTRDVIGVDFTHKFGYGATMINIGVNGIVCAILVILIGSDLNGPSIGCIFTVIGFSATGKHLFNILPIMAGLWIGTLIGVYEITGHGVVIAFLLSTTLAPISSRCGVLAGVMAGFVHLCVSQSVGVLYGGMNLYNNGFAGGLVAAFLVPVLESIESRRARARGNIDL